MTNVYSFDGILVFGLLFICTCAYLKKVPRLNSWLLSEKKGVWGVFYKVHYKGLDTPLAKTWHGHSSLRLKCSSSRASYSVGDAMFSRNNRNTTACCCGTVLFVYGVLPGLSEMTRTEQQNGHCLDDVPCYANRNGALATAAIYW
ncbi:hypothetical protein NFI96_033026 [Prochilodus magdalenae]|nr:hypothetical protein NFI96_033026 [Prochilodus magdalenae]